MNKYQIITNPFIDGNIKFQDDSRLFTAKSSLSGTIDIVFDKEYTIEIASPFKYKIGDAYFKLGQGTCDLSLLVNNVYVITDLAINSTRQIYNVNFDIEELDEIKIELSNTNNTFDLNYTLHLTQNE